MPLIFSENQATASGIDYSDETGVKYHYPKRISKNIIVPGERFIYYRGRRTHDGKTRPQVYFGLGIVGKIFEDQTDNDRLFCEILDYQQFDKPIPFKLPSGDHLETGGGRRGFFQRGVRRISETDYLRILELAEENIKKCPIEVTPPATGCYASSATAKIVDQFAVNAAQKIIKEKFGKAKITIMPHNNPGFDILVNLEERIYFVEVKGTQRPSPHFFMSKGELAFSGNFKSKYLLFVIYNVNLAENSYDLFQHKGEIRTDCFLINPIQYSIEPKIYSTVE